MLLLGRYLSFFLIEDRNCFIVINEPASINHGWQKNCCKNLKVSYKNNKPMPTPTYKQGVKQ